jgi:hypothetical protein
VCVCLSLFAFEFSLHRVRCISCLPLFCTLNLSVSFRLSQYLRFATFRSDFRLGSLVFFCFSKVLTRTFLFSVAGSCFCRSTQPSARFCLLR